MANFNKAVEVAKLNSKLQAVSNCEDIHNDGFYRLVKQ